MPWDACIQGKPRVQQYRQLCVRSYGTPKRLHRSSRILPSALRCSKCAVSLLVSLLDSSNSAELCSELGKALFLSVLSKAVVHIGPLVVLALSRVEKVLCGITELTKCLEPKLCVLLLVLSGLQEDCSDLLVSLPSLLQMQSMYTCFLPETRLRMLPEGSSRSLCLQRDSLREPLDFSNLDAGALHTGHLKSSVISPS